MELISVDKAPIVEATDGGHSATFAISSTAGETTFYTMPFAVVAQLKDAIRKAEKKTFDVAIKDEFREIEGDYTNSRKELKRRFLEVAKLEVKSGVYYVYAYDEEDVKSFIVTNLTEIIDRTTGKIYTPEDWIAAAQG